MTADDRLASDLAIAVVRLSRHLRGRRTDARISLTQLSAMSTLDRVGSMTPGALAARERVQPPSMTRVIATLADLGYVERGAHPTDGRQVIVSLSPAGKRLINEEKNAQQAWLRDQLMQFDKKQRKDLLVAVDMMMQLASEGE